MKNVGLTYIRWCSQSKGTVWVEKLRGPICKFLNIFLECPRQTRPACTGALNSWVIPLMSSAMTRLSVVLRINNTCGWGSLEEIHIEEFHLYWFKKLDWISPGSLYTMSQHHSLHSVYFLHCIKNVTTTPKAKCSGLLFFHMTP